MAALVQWSLFSEEPAPDSRGAAIGLPSPCKYGCGEPVVYDPYPHRPIALDLEGRWSHVDCWIAQRGAS